MTSAQWQNYTELLRRGGFLKLARLRFLNPDGNTAFALDNDPYNKRSGAFLRGGSVNCNLQNGTRWTASVTIANTDGEYDYNVNKVWFGSEIAIDMGLVLDDGTELYFPMGVYRISSPKEDVRPNGRTAEFSLTDKWSGLDGTLNGVLESSYIVNRGTNIFTPIATVLASDRGDGQPFDRELPLFTEYYNSMTQTMPDGTTVPVTDSPYTLTIDSDDGTVADLILGLTDMLVAQVGYDAAGRLRIDPSQNDILDTDKPVSWVFSLSEAQVTGLAYESRIADVRNDYIVVGMMPEDYAQPAARAQNLDPMSDTNINLIGRRTKRESRNEFATDRICEDYAVWMLKRTAVLHKAVTVECNQIFHLAVNELIQIVRSDLDEPTTETHLVQGFTIPMSGTEPMSITAVSVHDFPSVTVTAWGETM